MKDKRNRYARRLAALGIAGTVVIGAQAAPTHLVDEKPVDIKRVSGDVIVVDFGRVAYGNIRLIPSRSSNESIVVHFGEDFKKGRINRKPPGTVRYNKTTVTLKGRKPVVAAPPADKRNTKVSKDKHKAIAVLTPKEWGVVLPFRWVEIEGWKGTLKPEQIVRQSAYASTWNDDAASFECSDTVLNEIWELCRYSIKATTFAGVYVDGDRERIPYEADAYLNQLSHYYTDNDFQMARDTYDHLMQRGTWPTEWAPHMVFMAYADWMFSGDTQWIKPRYDELKSKLLLNRRDSDGWVQSSAKQIKRDDIIDWPAKERDGYVRKPVNTVVNAFHIRALEMMAELGAAIGKNSDAKKYAEMAADSRKLLQSELFSLRKDLFVDGIGTDHTALHANLFPLAFGLVPEGRESKVAGWLGERGMKCSVYAAQYLMEGLFAYGEDKAALELMIADGDRSWKHMVESGTTITWEAWDQKYKPNQDWNHAWGAAPANLLPRYVLGAEPLAPGWKPAKISPRIGNLKFAKGKIPTPHGPILIHWKKDSSFKMKLDLPKGMEAQVDLPNIGKRVYLNGKPVKSTVENGRLVLAERVLGTVVFEVK